jgi:hypothetical protein
MLLSMLYKYLLEHTSVSEGTLMFLYFLLAVGLVNCVRIFRNTTIKGLIATVFNLVLPGLGQVYMKQLKLGIALAVIFVISFLFDDHIPLLIDSNKGAYFYVLIGLALALQFIFIENAQKTVQAKWVHQLGAFKYKRMIPVIEKGTVLCLDTNILLHEQTFLIALFRDSDAHLFVSKQVYRELDGLKKNNKRDVRNRTQLAFDIIELFQGEKRMTMLEVPPHSYLRDIKLASNPDEIIIGTYLFERDRVKNPVVFLSNDKGARILAANANLDTVTI